MLFNRQLLHRTSSIPGRISLVFSCLIFALTAAGQQSDSFENGVVTSSSQYASDIGIEVLREGGNAVDAAVAVAYTLAVTHPAAGNIGGGGFMVLYQKTGVRTAIDYRETAPENATRDMYLDDEGQVITRLSRVGPKASGVPGTVAGLSYALERYGTLPLEILMAPAIQLARDGFVVSERLARSLNSHREYLSKNMLARYIYVPPDTIGSGDILKLPHLAETLELIAEEGPTAFYEGRIADNIVETMQMFGGLITREDLASYQVRERDVIHGVYRGYDMYSMPPPSSGGIAVTGILGILEAFPIAEWGHNSAKTLHFKTEAERHIYADRNYFLGDPDFVDLPVDVFTSPTYYRYLRSLMQSTATPSSAVDHLTWETIDSLQAWIPEHEETTHFSVIDKDGNAVSNTYTLNGAYGAGYAVVESGFLMNNEMDDFSAKPGVPNMYGLIGAEANAIEPGKRMLSSMSPTIVTKDGKPVLITGTPGGSTIITTTAQIIMNVIDHNMPIHEAVAAPRVHSQWLPDYISMEPAAINPLDQVLLQHAGHTIRERSSIGEANSIYIDPGSELRYSGADATRGGTAAGY